MNISIYNDTNGVQQQLDKEWYELIKEAKDIGLSREDLEDYFSKKE